MVVPRWVAGRRLAQMLDGRKMGTREEQLLAILRIGHDTSMRGAGVVRAAREGAGHQHGTVPAAGVRRGQSAVRAGRRDHTGHEDRRDRRDLATADPT